VLVAEIKSKKNNKREANALNHDRPYLQTIMLMGPGIGKKIFHINKLPYKSYTPLKIEGEEDLNAAHGTTAFIIKKHEQYTFDKEIICKCKKNISKHLPILIAYDLTPIYSSENGYKNKIQFDEKSLLKEINKSIPIIDYSGNYIFHIRGPSLQKGLILKQIYVYCVCNAESNAVDTFYIHVKADVLE
jgi:hypothetical protein